MKFPPPPLFLLAFLGLFSACHSSNPVAYERLDAAISQRDAYQSAFERRVDSLGQLPGFWSQFAVFDAYSNYSMDSVLVYVSRLEKLSSSADERLLAACARCFLLSAHREYDMAWELLQGAYSSELSLYAQMEGLRYLREICLAASNDNSLSSDRQVVYIQRRRAVQRDLMEMPGLSDYFRLYYRGKWLQEEGFFSEALEQFFLAEPFCPDDERRIHLCYAIAGCYNLLGEQEQWKNWLARTAILDMKCCHRKYRSLYDLSLALYNEGEFSRSNRYLQITMTDAIACNFDTRIINASVFSRIVESALLEQNHRIRRLIVAIIVLVFLSLIGAMMAIWKINKQRLRQKKLFSRLRTINVELKRSYAQIQEDRVIREKYLFRYMLLSAQFVENINEYRQSLLRILKENGPEKMRETLRDMQYIYMQFDSFYQLFDDIFLGVFPTFINDVNQLLSSESQLVCREDGALSTELRILAVIRLGLSKSGKIAQFLNISPNTVYTYRTALKKASIVGEDAFEERVSRIVGMNNQILR